MRQGKILLGNVCVDQDDYFYHEEHEGHEEKKLRALRVLRGGE